MEYINSFIEWIKADPKNITVVLTAIVGVATVIVGATKTDKDDKVLNVIIKILDTFSLLNPRGTTVVKEDEKKES